MTWTTPPPPRPPSHNARNLGVLVVVLVLVGLAQQQRDRDETTTRTAAPVVAARTATWKWVDDAKCTYSSSSRCWAIRVVAPDDGCRSLYVSLTIMDAAGTAIDHSSRTLTGLAPGQQGLMVFDTFEDSAKQARVVEVKCR